jgi:hypothetical protein
LNKQQARLDLAFSQYAVDADLDGGFHRGALSMPETK